MTGLFEIQRNTATGRGGQSDQRGFTLTEFLISVLILLVVVSVAFSALSEMQRTASYQTEVQSVINNTRIAVQTIERYLRQAGNDPSRSGLSGITIVSATEVRVQSDLTGSLGPSNPDKGDPDGDVNDSGENITIRFNRGSRSLEIVHNGNVAQVVASHISGLSFSFFDASGAITAAGSKVRKVAVAVSGSSLLPDPQTHRVFGVTLGSEIAILT